MTTPSATRLPAQDQEAERALLGAMMSDPEAPAIPIRADDWYVPWHASVHAALTSLYADGKPTDPVAVTAEMARHGTLTMTGGHLAVFDLAESCPAAVSAPHYAEIVRSHGLVRRVQRACAVVHERGYGPVLDARVFADEAEAAVFGATDPARSGEVLSLADVLTGVMDRIDAANRGEYQLGLPTGFASLDHILGGLHPGNLVLIAARPSVGKTAMGLQVARHVAGRGEPVLFWSLEMSADELTIRLLAAEARVNLKRLVRGALDPGEWRRVSDATEPIHGLPMTLLDRSEATPLDVRSWARKSKPALIVVDYVQLMHLPGRHERRESEIAAISRSLKHLAMELRIPILALAQLNRESERANRAPALSDLRDSGSLEQDSDAVVLLHRDMAKGAVIAHVAKHRNGPVGKTQLRFVADYAMFEDGGQS